MTTATSKKSKTNKSSDDTRKFNPITPSKVKAGDIMAFINWVEVTSVGNNGSLLHVDNLDGGAKNIKIDGRELVEKAVSACQYEEEVFLSRTNVLKILVRSFNRPFTVVFDKKDGSERTLRGRLLDSSEQLQGYSYAEDLDLPQDDRIRQVDHRTVKSLIVDGVKYSVK